MTNRLVDPLLLERPLELERPQTGDRRSAPRAGAGNKRRLSSISGLLVLLLAALVMVPVAQANDTTCGVEGVPAPFILPPGNYDNVVVPEGGTCWILGDSATITIKGNVTAFPGSRLFMRQVPIGGNVTGLEDSIVQISGLPRPVEIGGDVVGDKVDLLEVQFAGNIIRGDIHVTGRGLVPAAQADIGVHICGAMLPNGNIEVEKMTISRFIRLDIAYCSVPNTLQNGSIKVEDNFIPAGVEGMHIGQAQIANGNLHVFKNRGGGPKTVTGNNVMNGDIQCYENEAPFVGGPNIGRAPKSPPLVIPPVSGPNQCSGTSS